MYLRPNGNIKDILKCLPNTYVTACHGKTTIEVLSYAEKMRHETASLNRLKERIIG
jgi:hypothetical protein